MLLASYLGNGLITWGVPLALLVVIGIYWALFVRKHDEDF